MIALILMMSFAPVDTVTVGPTHYRVYTTSGVEVALEDVIKAAAVADVLFVGETHNDPVAHHLEYELLAKTFMERGSVSLSLEMFTRDVQYIVDEYLDDFITESAFLAVSNPWQNYATDYRGLIEFAKVHRVPVVAANAPRRYVNRVTRMGPNALADLSAQARAYLAPLPYHPASDVYEAEWNAVMMEAMASMRAAADTTAADSSAAMAMPMGETSDESDDASDAAATMPMAAGEVAGEMAAEMGAETAEESAEEPEHGASEQAAPAPPLHGGMAYMLDAQSLWDATMAYSVAEHLLRNPGRTVVHMVGGFHVENSTGIPEHLARYRPGTRTVIVAIRPGEGTMDFVPEDHSGLGDFVIVTDDALPRTFDSGGP